MKDSVKDKIVGCLYGQAVGDALGLGTEFMSKDEVKRNYPNGLSEYSQMVQDYHRKRWGKGDWTDDTDMMLCIAKAIIKDRCINPKTIANNFKQWFKNKPMGIGRHTYNILALSDYESNPEKAAEIIWILSNKNSAPNGGIMRTSVVGLWNEDVAENAERICKLTHTDTRCIGSCVIISELINHFVWHNMQLSFKEILSMSDFAANYFKGKENDRMAMAAWIKYGQSPELIVNELSKAMVEQNKRKYRNLISSLLKLFWDKFFQRRYLQYRERGKSNNQIATDNTFLTLLSSQDESMVKRIGEWTSRQCTGMSIAHLYIALIETGEISSNMPLTRFVDAMRASFPQSYHSWCTAIAEKRKLLAKPFA